MVLILCTSLAVLLVAGNSVNLDSTGGTEQEESCYYDDIIQQEASDSRQDDEEYDISSTYELTCTSQPYVMYDYY